jgi:hypothetical protein
LLLQVHQISLRPWRFIGKMPRFFLPLGNVREPKVQALSRYSFGPHWLWSVGPRALVRCTVGALTTQPLKNMILSGVGHRTSSFDMITSTRPIEPNGILISKLEVLGPPFFCCQ